MTAYLIIQAMITNEEKWTQYRKAVVPLIQTFGGRHISRGGSAQLLEGTHESCRIAMFEFLSMDAIREFWNSAEYKDVKELRRDAATLEVWAVPGE